MRVDVIQEEDLIQIPLVQPADWGDVKSVFAYYVRSNVCLAVKISVDGEIRATGALIFHDRSAWIGHVMVKLEYRGRGLGMKITQHLVDIAKSRGYDSISLVSTPEGKGLYQKLGFVRQWDYVFYHQLEGEVRSSVDTISFQAQLKPQALELDFAYSCEDRSAVLEEHWEQGQFVIKNGVLVAFYLPTLQEGLIISKEDEIGIELAKLRVNEKRRAVVPETKTDVINLMQETGMSFLRRGTRMYLGRPIEPNTHLLYNRIGGNLG